MNRSLNLLRPVGARGLASARVKPTALALRQPLPTPFAQSPLAAFGPFGIRRYASSAVNPVERAINPDLVDRQKDQKRIPMRINRMLLLPL
jgi:hypothetical protein